jgi:hypothetical protein
MTVRLRSILVLQALIIAGLLTLSLDIYAHKRVERLGGVNVWGYRGPTVRVKAPNEIRIGIVGGTLAFGWGVAASETTIAGVRQLVALAVDRRGQKATPVTAVNLGALGWAPVSYAARLDSYRDLGLDVVCVYPDPAGTTARVALPGAPLVSGYTPILSLVVREKLGWRAEEPNGRPLSVGSDDQAAVEGAVRTALPIARGVVLVLPSPAPSQLASGWEPLADRFASNPRVRVVDLSREPRLREPAMRLDDNSFGAAGNAAAAEHIAPAVVELLQGTR